MSPYARVLYETEGGRQEGVQLQPGGVATVAAAHAGGDGVGALAVGASRALALPPC